MKIRQINKLFIILFIIFVVTRTVNLTLLPTFNDESIYINFGQIMTSDPNNRFYSLFDGKQPLLMWLFGLSSNIFTNPFLAGRVVSVFFSIFTFGGIYLLSKKILPKPYYFLPPVIYTITPLFLFFDRQALMEGPLNTISIWSLYFLIVLTRSYKMRFAFILGIILGIGLFIKSTALVFAISALFYLIYLIIKNSTKNKSLLISYIVVILLTITAVLFPLILNPGFSEIINRGDRFNLTLSEIIKFPISLWFKNIYDLFTISFWQTTPTIFILSLAGIFLVYKSKKNLIFLYWFIIPAIISILTIRGFSPRYAEALLPPIVFFASYFLLLIKGKPKYIKVLSYVTLLIPIYLSLLIILNPIKYFDILDKFTPKFSEKNGYITSDTSGYGLKEAIGYLEEISKNSPIIVGVRLDAGNPENAILAYFFKHPNIKATYLDKKLFPENFNLEDIKSEIPVYFISRSQHQGGLEGYLTEEKKFYKPEEQSYIGVYKFKNIKDN